MAVVWGEVAHRGTVATYQVRSTGVPVTMMHGRDVEALSELFVTQDYEPPAGLRERFSPSMRILDIGANVGMFSAWALGRFEPASIIAFEPSSESLPLLHDWADRSGAPIDIVPACAAAADGEFTFLEGRGSGSLQVTGNSDAYEGLVTVPAVDVLPYLRDADFAKIDIEGGEWALLADERLAQVDRLTVVMEYHRHLAPRLPALDAARDLLHAAGFETGHVNANYWGHGVLWAWKG